MVLRQIQLPIGIIKETRKPHGSRILWKHLLSWRDDDTGEIAVNLKLPVMIDNWIRLGIIKVRYDRWLTDASEYAWMEKRPELEMLRSQFQTDESLVNAEKGLLEPTDLGQQFAIAVGIISSPNAIMSLMTGLVNQVPARS